MSLTQNELFAAIATTVTGNSYSYPASTRKQLLAAIANSLNGVDIYTDRTHRTSKLLSAIGVGLDNDAVWVDPSSSLRRRNWTNLLGVSFSQLEQLVDALVGQDAEPEEPYVAQAVHFDGATNLLNETLASPDGNYQSFSFWAKFVSLANQSVFASDSGSEFFIDDGNSRATMYWQDTTGDLYTQTAGDVIAGTWQHILWCVQTNLGAGSKRVAFYINDASAIDENDDSTGSFVVELDGSPFSVGVASLVGDMADFRMMPGVNLFDGVTSNISEATRRLFLDDDGKPVAPSVATAALGAPAVLLSGNAASFATNQGTGGAFVVTGTLTNASTSPSD